MGRSVVSQANESRKELKVVKETSEVAALTVREEGRIAGIIEKKGEIYLHPPGPSRHKRKLLRRIAFRRRSLAHTVFRINPGPTVRILPITCVLSVFVYITFHGVASTRHSSTGTNLFYTRPDKRKYIRPVFLLRVGGGFPLAIRANSYGVSLFVAVLQPMPPFVSTLTQRYVYYR